MDAISLDDQRGRQCNVCYHAFSREGEHVPRILSCGHTYCTVCLSKLVGKFSRGKICCPTCKTDTSVPGLVNNVQKLAKNFAVLDILEGLEEVLRGSSLATNQMLLCNKHDNEPKKVYCLTDSVVICIYCQVYGPHKGHECQLVSQVAANNREILSQLQEDLSSQKATLLPAWRHLQEVSNSVQLKEEDLMREVRQHFDVLRRKLCRREKEIASHLKSLTSGKVVVLHKQCRRIGELMDRVEQLKMACQTYISGPDYEVVLKMQSLKRDIEKFKSELPNNDLSPCASNNLACDLPQDLQGVIAGHGAVVESKENLERERSNNSGSQAEDGAGPPQELDQSQQDQSLPATETSYSGASGDEEDASHIRWQDVEMPSASSQSRRHVHSTPRPRQRLQRPDVIIFDNVGDLDEIDPSVCQVRPICQCHAEGGRGRCDLYVHSGRRRHGERDASRNDEDTFQDVSDLSSDTSSSAPSPDFSDVSDLDLDLPLRSAWANRGGWSSAAQQDGGRGENEELGGEREGATVRVSAREVVAKMDRGQRSEDAAGVTGAVGGQAEDAQSSSDEAAPRNPDESSVTVTGQTLPSGVHIHPRPNLDPKCSVFNCSSKAATSVHVRCKNCSRVFCQSCVHHSSSARRCYKRPRGHSFVYIPHPSARPNNTSSNNNNIIPVVASTPQGGHRHRRHHHYGYHHHHHHHHNQHSSSRRQHHSAASSARRHHHHHQHALRHHGNEEFSQHAQQQQRDNHRSRSRGRHRSLGGQECEEGHGRGQREGRYSQAPVESIFQDLII